MATEGGIKQDVAAARSLLRHLEQAQARWLARLANPVPSALAPEKNRQIELIEALGDFDPVAGLDALMGENESGRRQPIGIGARSRDTISKPDRPSNSLLAPVASAGAVCKLDRPGNSAPNVVRKGDAAKRTPRPNDSLEPDNLDPATPGQKGKKAAFRLNTPDSTRRKMPDSVSQAEAPRNHSVTALKGKSNSKSKAQQVAESRKALSRGKSPAKTTKADTANKPERRMGPKAAERKQADAFALARPDPHTPPLERALRQTLRNTPLPGGAVPNPGSPSTPESHLGQHAATRHRDAPDLAQPASTRHRRAIQIDEVTAEVDPPPAMTPPAPAPPNRITDDLAQQLADAARLHGVDLS
jgi:hypothetical protein